MSKIGYNQKGNPFNRKNSGDKLKQIGTNYIDFDGDGKAEGWEYGVEALTWVPTVLAAAATSPTGPGAVAAGAATKVGVTQLVKAGVKKLAKSKIGKWMGGGAPKTTKVLTGVGKSVQLSNAVKKSEMQDSGYQDTRDIPEDEDARNILD